MDISTVIVSFNTKELLLDCLKSLEIAARGFVSEIFVVDNNSGDGTAFAVKKEFPQVKLIANKKNLGFSRANNQALKIAKGKYILILNPDTKLSPDTLRVMINFMDEHRDVAVSTCRVQLPDGSLDRDCRRHFPTPWRAFCHFSGLSKLFRGSKIFDQYYMGYLSEDKAHEIDSCAGSFMMIKRIAIKNVGLFDESFFFYGEDLDWCWRFKEAGYKIIYTPQTKITHYKGVASGIKQASKHLSVATKQSKKRALKESTRAMELFYKKHYKGLYPFFITWLVIFGVKLLGQIRLLRA